MKKSKQVMAGFLVMAMAVVGILSTSVVNATGATEQTVEYEALSLSTYWKADGEGTAPTKEDSVFGGWFKSVGENTYTALSAADIDENGDGEIDFVGTAYAKWVPSYVLSVKAQIDLASQQAKQAAGENGNAFLRVISTVDSTDYQEVGFDLFYDKTYKETENTVITKVYESIKNTETGEDVWTPENEFGPASDFFSVLKVNGISNDNCDNILYVRPYWKTMDGTRVEGVSKYVRVMDGYDGNEFISVPVNLMTGSKVSAGRMTMTYNTGLKYIGYEPGVLLPNMSVNAETNGTIKFVGNTLVEAGDVEPESNIYANVWFQVEEGATEPEQWDFTMAVGDFCNWAEELVEDLKAWNITY